jgi:hypothetical protein
MKFDAKGRAEEIDITSTQKKKISLNEGSHTRTSKIMEEFG